MKLNRRKLRRLIEASLYEQASVLQAIPDGEAVGGVAGQITTGAPKDITDLLKMIYGSYQKELNAFNPIVLAMVASGNSDNLMAVYERASNSFEDKEAGLKAVFERMQDLAREYQ